MQERWFIKNIAGNFEEIAKTFGISVITARVLVNRGLYDEKMIYEFLNAEKIPLSDPRQMCDMEVGAKILAKALSFGKKLRIIGDYDVDGVCSTYILYDYFKRMKANVSYEIPDRVQDGYGINRSMIDQAKKDGVTVLLTCDNGIAAYEEVDYAKKLGMTVLVTDHHDIPLTKPIPPADAVINPKREDCNYPFKKLCGAGVAYQFIHYYNAVYAEEALSIEEMEESYLPFAALATVCDVMELKGENRTIVKKGLISLQHTKNIGMKALLNIAGMEEAEKLTVYHCGFVIGPIVNASGRLESAKKALEVFLAEDMEKALLLAEELVTLNLERKAMTEEGVNKACEMAENADYAKDTVLVLFLENIHESIAGIVAGRVKERFHKPTLIFTLGERGVKGSGRSIEEYNMFEEISKCAEVFTKFGGHPMAAGFTLKGDTVEEAMKNFKLLRQRLNLHSNLSEVDLMPKVHFDMELPLMYATEELIQELSLLEPFGTGNPRPFFAKKGVQVYDVRVFGKNENVVKLELIDGECCTTHSAIWFGESKRFKEYLDTMEEKKLDIIYTPEINVYRDRRSVSIKMNHFR